MCVVCSLRNPNDLLAQYNQHQAQAAAHVSAANPGSAYWAGFGKVTEAADAAESTSTAYSMIVGQSFYGTLSSGVDEDWVAITLTAGTTYDFRLLGLGSAFLSDPLLRLYNSSGVQIASDDDGFTSSSNTHEKDSALTFTATTSGTYYLEADAFSSSTGKYLLSATADVAAGTLFTVDEMAWQLINNGQAYFGSTEAAAFNVGADKALSVNITALTTEGQFLARHALQAWTNVTGIAFTETTGTAEITFDDSDPGSDAFANSITSGTTITSSTVMITTGWLADFGTTLNSYSFETYIHEIGHALGLGHAGNYNGSASYGVDNYYINDSVAWTIMSYMNAYNDEFDSGNPGDVNTYVDASLRYIFTPQIVDIIAIQQLYGTFSGAFTGNTTYGVGSNTGVAAIDGAINSGALMAMTIYDNGGVDTLNFSTATVGQVITLNAESLSSVMGGRDNLGIARGVVIEHVLGGSGIDEIYGNSTANALYGNAGNDIIKGEAGADALVGGLGNDTINGGADNDTLLMDDFTNPAASSGTDKGFGDAGADLLWGYGGNDELHGGADNDSLVGNDYGSNIGGFDLLFGEAGNDILFVGLGGNAYMDGGTGNDTFFGGSSSETLRGGTGNDYLYGASGADAFQFYRADFASGDSDIVYFVDAGDRLKFSADLNGALFFQDLPSLEYSPGLFTTGVYITAFIGGGATSTITVYGSTVAALTPMVDYTL